MMWKLIKALVRRIKAWYSLRNHIERLLNKTEAEIDKLKDAVHKSMENELCLHYLYEKQEEYNSLLRHMRDCESSARIIDEDVL